MSVEKDIYKAITETSMKKLLQAIKLFGELQNLYFQITTLTENQKMLMTDKEIAKTLHDFFSSIIKTLRTSISDLSDPQSLMRSMNLHQKLF